MESRNLDTRKTEDTGGLVAAVAGLVDSRTCVPHRKGRPTLKDERRRRKEAEAKNVVLQQKVKIMQESLAGQVHDEEARMDIVGNPEVAVMFLDMKLKTQAVGMQRRAEERKQLEAEVESLKVALKTERERTQELETKEADGSRFAVGEMERERKKNGDGRRQEKAGTAGGGAQGEFQVPAGGECEGKERKEGRRGCSTGGSKGGNEGAR